MSNKKVLKPVDRGHGGVSLVHNKDTADMETVRMPIPKKVVLPMQQHIGAPCEPLVKVGDIVDVGQKIGDTDKFVSAPIHASISGKVVSVADYKLANGNLTKAVTIESDGEMRLSPDIKPPEVNSKQDFLKAIRESGLVGLGGAGFPAHVKYAFSPESNIDTLIINAAECEPYITVDHRECLENSWDILSSIHIIQDIFDFDRVVIAIEDNKKESLDVLKRIAENEANDDRIQFMLLSSKYPQGAEKIMIQSVTGRRVPPGKLPSDVGCIVSNIASVAFIGRYIKTGKPLVSRSLTVDGTAIKEPKNIRVPIGTIIDDIIEFCGGLTDNPYKVICGGPMMGSAISDTNIPILKNNNALLAFSDDTIIKKERDCIRCGRCAHVCPMNLMPTLIERFTKAKDAEALSRIGINVCMECGSCAYACPAGKPLVQHMRLAKSLLREAGVK